MANRIVDNSDHIYIYIYIYTLKFINHILVNNNKLEVFGIYK